MSHISTPAQRARRRAPTACRPCRKQRKKCLHNGLEPCKSCVESNMIEECSYVERGEQNVDRQFRHPRMRRADRVLRKSGITLQRGPARGPGPVGDHSYFLETTRGLLPDVDIVLASLDAFFGKFSQLSFLPGDQFVHRVRENIDSVSGFLLCSILAVSARFSRPLRDQFGGGANAIIELMERAEHAARLEVFEEVATLERCQAFLLLSIAQQGSGRVRSSHSSAGLALGVATSLGLHREQTYVRMMSAPVHQSMMIAESARRTFWYTYCLNNSISGPERPVMLPAQEISTYPLRDVPAFDGRLSSTSSPYEARPASAAHTRPHNFKPPSLAAYLQVLDLWGTVARLAACRETRGKPARSRNSIAEVLRRLDEWDRSRPLHQTFDSSLLASYRSQALDLAYLDINATFRLCHIVLRKAYLNDMILQPSHASQIPDNEVGMYRSVMKDLFVQVRQLFQNLDSRFEYGSVEDKVGSALTCFELYTVGVMATYLYKCPQIDLPTNARSYNDHDRIRDDGLRMYTKVSYLLRSCQDVWAAAGYWHADLENWHHAFDTKVIRARVDAVLARTHNGTKPTTHHPQAGPDLQPSAQLDDGARLAPLQNTHPARNTKSLPLPSLKNDSYSLTAHGLPSLPSPPSTRPADPVSSGKHAYLQGRLPQPYDQKHPQRILDHRPQNPAKRSPCTSAGLPSMLAPQHQTRGHDYPQSYVNSQSRYGHKESPSRFSPDASHISSSKVISPSSTPNGALSRSALTGTTWSSEPYFSSNNSSPDHSDDESSDYGLQDGYEKNLEIFLQTGAIWAASVNTNISSPCPRGASSASSPIGREDYRYALTLPPVSATAVAPPTDGRPDMYNSSGGTSRLPPRQSLSL